MNSVFELGGDFVRREVAHNLMRIIAEGIIQFTQYIQCSSMFNEYEVTVHKNEYD